MSAATETRPVVSPLITISVPVFNEEDCLPELLSRLDKVAATETSYEFEFLFTDDGSTDNTFAILSDMARDDSRIRVLRFSRNFGFQKSVLTNFLNARGDAAIEIDGDLQDPPEIISDFLREWERGYKVVYGIRRTRREGRLINATRQLYYRLVAWMSETDLPRDAGDCRLIDRVIIEHLRDVSEHAPYVRGLIANMGYAQIGIPYDRDARFAGRSKFGFFRLLLLAIDGITSQSTRPLRLITIGGFFMSILSLFAAAIYIVDYFVLATIPSGFTTIAVIAFLTLGINVFIFGIIGEYIGRIFNNTRDLPLSIIEQRIEPIARARIPNEPAADPSHDA